MVTATEQRIYVIRLEFGRSRIDRTQTTEIIVLEENVFKNMHAVEWKLALKLFYSEIIYHKIAQSTFI